MIQIPEQVKDAPIVRMKNAVLVGTMKFTLDRFDASFDAEENPAPPRLAAQLAEFRTSYEALNTAYALTRESLITQDIAALDEEGDQLYLGLKETVEGARRMTYMPARKEAGVSVHWDHAYYNGHYYMYFGVVPVLLLFLPFRLLTGQALTQRGFLQCRQREASSVASSRL